MTYKQCLQIAVTYLGDDKLTAAVNGEGMGDDFTAKQLKTLSACADLVINEIACEYYPLRIREKLRAIDGKIDFARLRESLVEVYAVRREGVRVPYKLTADGLETQGEVEIEYSYAPAFLHPTDETELPFKGGKITPRVVGLGMAAEYCVIMDRADDAILLDDMFRKALVSALTDRGNLRVKKRKWV